MNVEESKVHEVPKLKDILTEVINNIPEKEVQPPVAIPKPIEEVSSKDTNLSSSPKPPTIPPKPKSKRNFDKTILLDDLNDELITPTYTGNYLKFTSIFIFNFHPFNL